MKSLLLLTVPALLAPPAHAQVIGFEDFAPPGGLINVNPSMPYTEAGFVLTPANAESAVFDSAATVDMPGDTTDFFGFQEQNLITLRRSTSAPFDLASLRTGPTTLAVGPVTITITGYHAAGAPQVLTLPNLTTATPANLNWTALTRVEILSSDDAGLDDITIGSCYPNCDASTAPPVLNVNDFSCFLNRFATGDPYTNCDGSTSAPILNVNDFSCFVNRFAAGCP